MDHLANIKSWLSQPTLSTEELISLLNQVMDMGYIYVIKGDSGRAPGQRYTVMITAPDNRFELIRNDSADLNGSIVYCLHQFVEVVERNAD